MSRIKLFIARACVLSAMIGFAFSIMGFAPKPATTVRTITVAAQSELDFILVNDTGYPIKNVYVTAHSAADWDAPVYSKRLESGESIMIKFSPRTTIKNYDLKVDWYDADGGGSSVWEKGYDLTQVESITLKYNKQTDVTTAIIK